MEYKYLDKLVEHWNKNDYFDNREVKGCTQKEINELKNLISPYMQRMPKAIEEELFYIGKYRFNGMGIFLQNKFEVLMEDEIRARMQPTK